MAEVQLIDQSVFPYFVFRSHSKDIDDRCELAARSMVFVREPSHLSESKSQTQLECLSYAHLHLHIADLTLNYKAQRYSGSTVTSRTQMAIEKEKNSIVKLYNRVCIEIGCE